MQKLVEVARHIVTERFAVAESPFAMQAQRGFKFCAGTRFQTQPPIAALQ
jgi:hypothetical protein